MPPVYSPLSWGALRRGFRAMTSRRAYEEALSEIDDWMRQTFDPATWLWTDSGTTALTLALKLAAEKTGSRRVALPAYGCYDLATACDGADAEVLLYDIDPSTLGPDWNSLERALDAGAKTIVAAHLYGMPVDMNRARTLAAKAGAVVVEDAAQAIGATLVGRPCGSLGDLSVLSFGRGKGVTSGGGGALLARDEDWLGAIAAAAGRLAPGKRGAAALGKSVVQHLLARPSLYRIPAALPFLRLGETIYLPSSPAGTMSRSAAGVLTGTLRLAVPEMKRRRGNAVELLRIVATSDHLRPVTPTPGAEPGYLRLPVVVGDSCRAGTQAVGAGPLGVMPGYPAALTDLAGFTGRVLNAAAGFPGARSLAAELVTLPTHDGLMEGDLGRLEEWLRGADFLIEESR